MPKSKTPKKKAPKQSKPPKSTGKQRKDFAIRMLVDSPKPVWSAELKACKDIFEQYPLDFLLKIKKPPFKINSCFFFLSQDGKDWLKRKLQEFLYKPKRHEIIPGDIKEGEDWQGSRRLGFREFLK